VALDEREEPRDDPVGLAGVAQAAQRRDEQPGGVHPRGPAPAAEQMPARAKARLLHRHRRDPVRRSVAALVEEVLLDEAAADRLGQRR
jgi:hypothetical protein